jgi:hypothetical protein
MSVSGRSLAIILGASDWPSYSSFETAPAFENSANFFRDYLLGESGLGLPQGDLLWLFDDEGQPGEIIKKMGDFLRARAVRDVQNVFFYYVGHGGYLDKAYFVALRCTDQANRDLTVMPVKYIAKKLQEEVPDKRHIIILDACYASGAVKEFIYQDAGIAIKDVTEQLRESLQETDINVGTAVFCAAGPKTKAKAPWETEFTMFSGALRRALMKGDPTASDYLSLRELAEIVEKDIFNTFRTEAVRPELHTPKQEEGDIRNLRLIPNPAKRAEISGKVISELMKSWNETKTLLERYESEIAGLKNDLVMIKDRGGAGSFGLQESGAMYTVEPEFVLRPTRVEFILQNFLSGLAIVGLPLLINGFLFGDGIYARSVHWIPAMIYGAVALSILISRVNLGVGRVVGKVTETIFGRSSRFPMLFWAFLVGGLLFALPDTGLILRPDTRLVP